jgi:mycothiol synthase
MAALAFEFQSLNSVNAFEICELLEAACEYDPASILSEEKLVGPGPSTLDQLQHTVPHSIVAVHDDMPIGIAAIDGARIRLLAVDPKYRSRGVGTALLAWCQAQALTVPEASKLWAMGQAGNYLAPGIDERNTETIDWLARRGWHTTSDIRTNLVVAARDNPLVTRQRAHVLNAAASAAGYIIRRARPDETALLDAIAAGFGGAWPFEVAAAMKWRSDKNYDLHCGVHVATRGDQYCAFAAHDGNNRGAGWFGPAGTWPAHRGRKLGEAVLIQCLLDVAVDHAFCEIAWIGPEAFYQKSCGMIGRRTFVPMFCLLNESGVEK